MEPIIVSIAGIGLSQSGLPISFASPRDEVEYALREVDLFEYLAEVHRRERRLGRGLYYRRAAGGEDRSELRRHVVHREVPREGGEDYAERLADRHEHALAAGHVADAFHVLRLRLFQEELEVSGEASGFKRGVRAQLAGFEHEERQEVVGLGGYRVAKLQYPFASLFERERAPLRERSLRGFERGESLPL